MKFLFFFLLSHFFICGFSAGQVTIPELKNSSNDSSYIKDSSVQLLLSGNRVLIMYRMLQAIPGSQNFKVIGLGKDGKWQCYIVKWGYYKSLWTEKENPIRSIDISQDSIKQVYRIFVDNEIFSMKNKEQIREACKGVSGSAGGRSYEIILFSENACKIIEYHEPELYKHKCPGYAEWQNLINLTKLLFPDKRY